LKKHGVCKFSLEILEYCDIENNLAREQYLMDLLKPQYNILSTAGSSTGYKHTEESRAKISACQKGIPIPEATRAKISAAKMGIKKSEETKAKMSAAHLGSKKSEESKLKSLLSSRTRIEIEVIDLETNVTSIYNSLRGAAIELGSNHTTLGRYMKSGKIYNKKYLIKGNKK
jgi:group I intron endonuclease